MNSSSNGIENTYWLVSLWKWVKFHILFIRPKEYVNDLYKDRIWTNIETMPIWNWNKIVETGELTPYMFRNGKGLFSRRLGEFWLDLQEQHILEFGIDDLLRQRLKLMTKLIKLNIQFVKTMDRNLLNFIEITEAQLKSSEGNYNIRFYKVLDVLTTHKRMSIDPKTFPVIQWYHALKNMSSDGKRD